MFFNTPDFIFLVAKLVSFPLIGLIQVLHYYVTYEVFA